MPAHGGFSPYPKRMGGGKPRLQVIHEGMMAQRGSAYSKEWSSIVWVETMAVARCINAAWSTNQRLANQADPDRMSDLLPRWEAILAAPVPSDATLSERRKQVKALLARLSKDIIHARVLYEAQRILGKFFVAIEYIDISKAVVHSPTSNYPFGTQATGYPWYSTVAHVLIRVQKPAGFTDADFWAKMGELTPVMNAAFPAWATWDWYLPPSVGTPINVIGGPSAGGWYLDEPNLDILVFDV